MVKKDFECGECGSEFRISHDEDEKPLFCPMCGELLESDEPEEEVEEYDD